MSSNKSSGIGLGTIIFWIFLGFMWFGDSDDSDTNVEIVSQDDIVAEEQVTLEEQIAENFNGIKDDLSDVVDKVKISVEQIQEDMKKEEPTIDEPEEIKVVEQVQEDELTPITNNQEDDEEMIQL